MHMPGGYLRTTDIAYALAVHPNTVRQYEAWGLLPPIPRSPSGYRLFTEMHLDQMRLARSTMAYTWLGGDISRTSYGMIRQAAEGDLGGALELAYQVMVLVQAERAQAEVAVSLLERWAQGTVTDATTRKMRIGEVAEYLNVTSDMLRNWERNGLIYVPRNPKNGYRIYGAKEISRLRVIRVLRRSRYSMMAILRMLLQLDGGEREGLRLALDTPRSDEDIGHATDKWLTTLEAIEPCVQDAIAQLEMMLKKRAAKESGVENKGQPGGRAIVIRQFSGILMDIFDCISPVIPEDQYLLCGTAAGLFQGVFQPVRDINLLTKAHKQVNGFAQAMHNFPQVLKPTYFESKKLYCTTHLIRGVEVSMAALDDYRDDAEKGDTFLNPWDHFSELQIGSYTIRAEALELRLATEIARERPRHYQPLIKHMQKHGADLELAQRAMSAKAISNNTVKKVISQIQNEK
jgi:DNA-binding transcriptional MerR regulator